MLPPHFYSLPTFRLLAIVLHYAKNPQYYYFGCSHYLLQCFTILKNPFIFTSILTCSGDLNVLCGSQVQIGVSLLGELFLHFWKLFHCVQILRNERFFSLSAFEANLTCPASDETASVILASVSLSVKLPLFRGLSCQFQPPLDCPRERTHPAT